MKASVVLDDRLVEEAFELTGVGTPKELVDLALQELVNRRRKKDMTELAGRLALRDDFDHKQLRELRRDPG